MNLVTKQVRGRIEQDKAFAQKVLGMSVVSTNAIAKQVGDGLRALQTMDDAEREKLKNLTPDEIVKGWENSDIKVMAKAIEHSLGMMSDALAGKAIRNPIFQIANKGLEHLQGNTGVQLIASNMAGPEATGIDLGWRRAFNFLSLTDAKEVEVMNWRNGLRFLEYAYRTDPPEPTTVGGRTNQRQSARFFASAFRHADGDLQHSVVTINELLSYMRAEALTQQSMLAYRTIFSKNVSGSSVVDNSYVYSDTNIFEDWSTTATDNKTIREYEVFQIRHVLNEVRRLMIDHAGQVQQGSKKRENFREAPLRVTANDTLLFYYNHAHNELIQKVLQPQAGEELVSPTLLANVAFIPTAAAPICGGYNVTPKDTGRDDWGFREELKESVNKKKGGMMVIPSNLNYFLNFRPLTFLTDRNVMTETNLVGAKFEANAIMDKRQKAHVQIADN